MVSLPPYTHAQDLTQFPQVGSIFDIESIKIHDINYLGCYFMEILNFKMKKRSSE